MSQTGTLNIEHLPIHILEKIFLNVPNRKNLKLVSKNLKNIVESSKLMGKYELNVTKYLSAGSGRITSDYEALRFEKLDIEHYNFINNYESKEKIKSIKLDIPEGEIEKYHITMQHILWSFVNLEALKIIIKSELDIHEEGKFYEEHGYPPKPDVIKLTENRASKLTSLSIDWVTWRFTGHIVEMFTEISSITKFEFAEFCDEFPETTWELEELRLVIQAFWGLNNKFAMEVLSKQKSCLKVLVMLESLDTLNYVVRHFPNLESLEFCGATETRLNDDCLVPNHKLKMLTIDGLNCDIELLSTVLLHYTNIEILKLMNQEADFSKKIKLNNLRKLIIITDFCERCYINTYFLNIEMPNLKVLEIDNYPDEESLEEIPVFENVEHLTICAISENLKFFEKFPRLRKLTLGYSRDTDPSLFINVLCTLPTLKHFEIDAEYLKLEVSFQEFISKCREKNIKLSSFYYYVKT